MDMCNCLKKSKPQLRKLLAGLIVFTGVVMGAQAEDYTWTGAVDSDWSNAGNWKDSSDNVPANPLAFDNTVDTVTIPSGTTNTLIITSDITNPVYRITIQSGASIFIKECDANFSSITNTNFINNGTIYFYNQSDSGTSSFSTPTDGNLGNFYFWGNVEIVINGVCSAAIFSMQADSADHYCSDDFTATLLKGSGTGKLTVSGEINLTRASSTDGVEGKFIIDTDLETNDTLWTHSGVILQINSGKTVTAANYVHSAPEPGVGNTFPNVLSQTIINGTFNATNTFYFARYYGATEVTIGNSGELNSAEIKAHAENYINPGSTVPFTNSGTITTTTLYIPYNVANSGTINTSGTNPSLSAASFSGAGTINLNGGGDSTSLTATSTSTTSAQYAIVLNNTDATISGNYSLTRFSATASDDMYDKSVTLNNATITASSVYLSGTSGHPLSLSGTGTTHTFEPTALTASWLSIDDKIILDSYTNDLSSSNCVPAVDPSVEANWYPLLQNGWNLMALTSLDYIWTGAVDTDWNTEGNWNTGFVPSTDCKITIPSGAPVIPDTGTSDFEGGTLTIAPGASLQLVSKNLVLSGTENGSTATILTNNGSIIYTGEGRIKDSSSAINDTAHGTVKYSGSGSGTITDFNPAADDYNNLIIEGSSWRIASTGTIKIKDTISIPSGSTCNISNTTTIQADTFDFNGTNGQESFSVAGSQNVTLSPYDLSSDFNSPLAMYTFKFAAPRGWVYLNAGTQNIVFNTEINGTNNYIPYKMRFLSNVKLNADIRVTNSVYAEKGISESGTLIFGGSGNIEFTVAATPYTYNKIKAIGPDGTLTINGPGTINELIIDGRETTIKGSNTITTFTAENKTTTIHFEAGTTQNITNLSLKGKDASNLLTLTSTGNWSINCANEPSALVYLEVENSANISSGIDFNALNSKDNGGNQNWIFPGQTYTWTGTAAAGSQTSWDNAGNWLPASIPGKGSIITIPAGGSPELASDVDISHTNAAYGKIEIEGTGSLNFNGHSLTANIITNSGEMDLAGNDLTVSSITNDGTIRLIGNENITATTINNSTGAVEYYDDTVSSPLTTFNWNSGEFKDLILSKSVNSSDTIKVNGTVTIQAPTSSITFTADTSVTIADAAEAADLTVTCPVINLAKVTTTGLQSYTGNIQGSSIEIDGDVEITGNVTTTGTQLYKGEITLGAASTFTAKDATGHKTITIKNSINSTNIPVFDSNLEANLSGGSVNTDIIIKGNFSDTGTWAAASGKKLIFNGTGTQTFTAASGTYENIELSKTSGTQIIFMGTPTITNLTEDTNAGNITFSDGANITNGAVLSTTGTVTVSGTIATSNAAFSANKLVVGNDASIETGSGAQSYGTINGNNETEALELTASSVTFGGIAGGSKKLASLTVNGAAVINGASLNADIITFKGNISSATSTLNPVINGDLVLGTSAAGITVGIPLTAKGNINFNGNNTIESLTATGLGGKNITFEAGKTQTINGKLILSGTADSDGNRLSLKSSTPGSSWTINCTRSDNDHDIQYVDVRDSGNTSTYNLFAFHSQDFGNNTKWNFPDMTYTWTGGTSTSWTVKENWNPQIVPSKSGNIIIPDVSAASGRYPLLAADVNILDTYNSVNYGNITIEENAKLDIAGFNLTVKEITNDGRLRLHGTSTPVQSITGTMSNGTSDTSVVEYYGGSTNAFIWDGNNNSADGKQYKNLEISGAASSSEIISVAGTTSIAAGAGNTVTLDSSSNLFSGTIIAGSSVTPASNAGIVTLKANTSVTIADNANASSLDVTCPSIKLTKVTTSATQTYTGAVSGPADTTDIDLQNTGLCTINGSLSARSLNMAGDASITGSVTTTATQTYNGNVSGGTAGGTVTFNGTNVTFKKSLTTTGTAAITANVFLDNATTADFGDSAGSTTAINITGNLIIHNGTITANTDVSVSLDTIILGSNYYLADSSTGIADEYAYNCARPTDWSQVNYSDALPSTHTAILKVAGGKKISVGKNFYANGTELSRASGTAKWILEIPDITNPGNGFAEAYHSDISNCHVICSNGTTDGTKAKLVTLECTDNGSATNSTNTNVDFEDFEIVETYTTRDNVVYVKFNRPVRNINGELIGEIPNIKFFDGTSDTAYDSIATQADGTSPLAAGSEPDTIYLVAPSTWNTDAGWAGSSTGITAGATNSTDRNGIHKSAKPYIDLPRSLGTSSAVSQAFVITDRFGKRLKHYGGTNRITTVLDKAGPVLVAVRTGQETHQTTLASQASYDAHNFIEFIYSEAVNFGSPSGTYLQAASVPEQNIQVSSDLGIVTSTPSSSTNLTFAGIGATIANGKIHTKRAGTGADDASMNAMYRDNTHSLKISVAGYAGNVSTSGTITGSYITWPGYIESALLPSGTVTTSASPSAPNPLITDCAVALNGTTPLLNQQIMQKTGLTVNNSEQTNTNYGKWDTQEPVFLRVHRHGDNSAQDSYEAVGNGDGSTLTRIEIHISDNPSAIADSTSFSGYWLTGFGWADAYNAASVKSAAADDLIGGARPYVTGTVNASHTTSGGIRYCTMLNQEGAFKYEVGRDNTPVRNFTSIEESASAPFFTGASASRNNIPVTKDNTYISLTLSDTTLPYKTTFTVSYDDSASYITDLAGNRLRAVPVMNTLDRTSPDFKISFAPVNQNKLFMIFVKKLTQTIKYNGAQIPESFETIIPQCVELGKITGSSFTANSAGDLQIDSSVPASIISSKSNEHYTAVLLTLNRNITMEDLEETYIRIKNAPSYSVTSSDPITGLAGSYVTFIQDSEGNYMPMYQAHTISDFAANMVSPLYAYNDDLEFNNENLTYSLYESGTWAVHDWDKEQQNYGTLIAEKPVTLVTNVDTSYFTVNAGSGQPDFTLRLYYSNAPTAGSESNEYNADIHDSLRLWVPDNSNFSNNGLLPAYAAATNQNFSYIDAIPVDDSATVDLSKGLQFKFDESMASAFTGGRQISFLFGLFDSTGTTQKSICLNPILTMSAGNPSYNTSAHVPLYLIRLKNPSDITSMDLWSFKVMNIAGQRGGVSILNNVINPLSGEKTVLKVNMPSDGKLNILVMTLDGNVIQYLNRGRTSAGEHYFTWDGKNSSGLPVARGMYFIRVTGSNFDETRKVLVVK